MPIAPDPLMNVNQIKQRLGCSVSYVYRMIEDGRLSPAVRLGHRRGVRVRASVVEKLILRLEKQGVE